MTAALLTLILLFTPVQSDRFAHGTYARNGILIGLSDLAPLRTCAVKAFEGKTTSVEIDNGTAIFELKSDTERQSFQFPLAKLDSPERKTLRRNFLQKHVPLRATGYACTTESQTLETISIDRVY